MKLRPKATIGTIRGKRSSKQLMMVWFTSLFLATALLSACPATVPSRASPEADDIYARRHATEKPKIEKVLEKAHEQIKTVRKYSQKYFKIAYPNGDVPAETGACTDLIIRSFRSAGVDLQAEIYKDISSNFLLYPKKWGLRAPDTNIDHRRVPNLQTFFTRRGKSLRVSSDAQSYRPGDVVTWDLDGRGTTHIGLVSNVWNERDGRYLIIHNIGSGTNAEDRLFEWKITGHFRYF